ncbi:MAG: HAD family hydrolase, partial [Caldilineales bacterium]|nr:HAD family hydrolase [Caldilineales bacterium]
LEQVTCLFGHEGQRGGVILVQASDNFADGRFNFLIPGVEATLQRLKPTYRLALVTTRDREAVGHFLQRNGLADLFDAVVTRDDVRRLKPHPEPVILAAQRLGLTPQECLMVGDTAVDIQAGGAAGARTVGVLCGFGQERDLADADRVLPTTADLDGLL